MFGWFKREVKQPIETRQDQGFTSEIIAARQAFFSGSRSASEATATIELCCSLWERAFSAAEVSAENLRSIITPQMLALIGRSLALRGQFVALIDGGGVLELVPAVDWDIATRNGVPIAYKLSIPEVGGGRSVDALAAEVVDIRINTDPVTPCTARARFAGRREARPVRHCMAYNASLSRSSRSDRFYCDQNCLKRAKVRFEQARRIEARKGRRRWRGGSIAPEKRAGTIYCIPSCRKRVWKLSARKQPIADTH